MLTLSFKQQSIDLLLALSSVILFYLAFPSGGYGHLSWFVMVPLLIAINNRTNGYAFLLGLLAATFGWMASIWWVVDALSQITSSPINLIIPLIFIFCILFALPYAIACWLHCRYQLSGSIIGAFQSALIFTCLVNYLPQILPGNLAHALYLDPQFIQLADIGGVPLVFFLIHAINLLLANAITLRKTNPSQSLKCLYCCGLIFIANVFYGEYRVEQFKVTPTDNTVTMALIQPNISIDKRSRADWLAESDNIVHMLKEIDKQHEVELFIMPEIPVPVSYRYFAEDTALFTSAIGDKSLILTAIEPIGNELSNNNGFYNTMEFIVQQRVISTYQKQLLLPFAEYIPFTQYSSWLEQLFPNAPHYISGSNHVVFELETDQGKLQLIPLICYESVFSEQVSKGIKQGGNVLLNSVNDAWFVNTAGVNVHLALSMYRSIEYRAPLVRATNTGKTAVITANGEFMPNSMLSENIQSYAIVDIASAKTSSLYQQFPYAFKYLCLLLLAVFLIVKRNKND